MGLEWVLELRDGACGLDVGLELELELELRLGLRLSDSLRRLWLCSAES